MKKCPHCSENIDYLDYEADYSERKWGVSWGTTRLDGINLDFGESDCQGSENFTETNVRYLCPECNSIVEISDLLPVESQIKELLIDTADNYNKECLKI